MSRISKHAILKDAAVLATFLQASDAAFGQCKNQYKQDRAAASGSVSGWLGDKMNTMSTNTVLESTEDDAAVQGALDYVLAWERQLTTVAKQSSQIVKSARDKGKALFEFGQAFSSLGLNETNQELGDVLSNVRPESSVVLSVSSAHITRPCFLFVFLPLFISIFSSFSNLGVFFSAIYISFSSHLFSSYPSHQFCF